MSSDKDSSGGAHRLAPRPISRPPVDPAASREAAGIAVVQWHHDVLAVLLAGTAAGTAGPGPIELRSRRLNLVELPEGGARGTFSFGRLDTELVHASWELTPTGEGSFPTTAAMGGQT